MIPLKLDAADLDDVLLALAQIGVPAALAAAGYGGGGQRFNVLRCLRTTTEAGRSR